MGRRVRGMVIGLCTCPNQLFSLVQWSFEYKATRWDGRRWSYIAGGFLIKGCIQIKNEKIVQIHVIR